MQLIRASAKTRSKLKWNPKDYSKILLDLTMNQFPDKNSQALSNQNAQSPQIVNPPANLPVTGTNRDSLELAAERLESKINRLVAKDSAGPIVPGEDCQEFDVLDYVRMTSTPASSVAPMNPESTETVTDSVPQYGEVDPYVDPAELTMNELQSRHSDNNQWTELESTFEELSKPESKTAIDSVNQTLEAIEDFHEQLDLLGSETANLHQSQSPLKVEIISAKPEKVDLGDNMNESAVDVPTGIADDEITPVAWFSESAPTEMANENQSSVPPIAVPIMNLETGEEIFDVRDFCDSVDGVIEPIPGSFEVDPDLFEFQTIDEVELSGDSGPTAAVAAQAELNSKLQASARSEAQVFVAGAGDVIQINGSDGFDHIDLACFDVKWASFSDQVIQIDNLEGAPFEIHHQEIAYALFADGVEVCLDTGKID